MKNQLKVTDFKEAGAKGFVYLVPAHQQRERFAAKCLEAGAAHPLLEAAGHDYCWRCGECFISPYPDDRHRQKSSLVYFKNDLLLKVLGA